MRISDFDMLMAPPEALQYSLMMVEREEVVVKSPKSKTKSSAKARTEMSGFCEIWKMRVSMMMLNRRGDRGQPCLTPR